MKLSTRSTYGVRAMLALAVQYGAGQLMVKEISEQQGLPATYLEQLMVLLRKAGLVTATRGARGGYVLSRPPSEITLAEVVEALEGPLNLSGCPTDAGCCGKPETCALKELWDDASAAMVQVLRSVTLAGLVDRQREKDATSVLMYHI